MGVWGKHVRGTQKQWETCRATTTCTQVAQAFTEAKRQPVTSVRQALRRQDKANAGRGIEQVQSGWYLVWATSLVLWE